MTCWVGVVKWELSACTGSQHSFWLIFWHADILSDLSSDMLSDRGWGPARHTELTGSRLRSGTPHWTHKSAVEVRHATLNSQDRGWGPARHTELTGSWLRSGTPHWTHRIVVEVRHATLNSQDRGWGPAHWTHMDATEGQRGGGGGEGGGGRGGGEGPVLT